MTQEIKRFFDHIKITEGCWLWISTGYNAGYGHYKFRGALRLAHRIAWEIEYGEIPKGIFVCHHCDNPRCVKPTHLFLGTQKDNMQDYSRKHAAKKNENCSCQ